VYVADEFNNRIQKFDSNGNFITEFDQDKLSHLIDVVIDSRARVYASDENNAQISIYELAVPPLQKLIDDVNALPVMKNVKFLLPEDLDHTCKDLDSSSSDVNFYESHGKLLPAQALDLREQVISIQEILGCI
jgi:hypothetical protein